MDSHLALPLSVAEISSTAHFSRYHFIRLFHQTFDVTPHQYLIHRRVERAKRLLIESDASVTDICFDVGFESLGSFSTLFRRLVGQSPSAFRTEMMERKRFPQKHIPACFLIMNGIPC
jgi:AraC-like DNA-binding protein